MKRQTSIHHIYPDLYSLLRINPMYANEYGWGGGPGLPTLMLVMCILYSAMVYFPRFQLTHIAIHNHATVIDEYQAVCSVSFHTPPA